MKQWYEVFISNEEGSRTLEIFDTVEEAKAYKEDLFKRGGMAIAYSRSTLHIDKWEDTDNPTK